MKTENTSKPNKIVSHPLLLCVFVGIIALVLSDHAFASFDPNANGVVRVIVVQPDGKILLGGDFTTLSPNDSPPVTRNHIARLNSDGTLDTSFDPSANGTVRAIALQSDGKVLVGGDFTTIGGQSRSRLSRLSATSGEADSFDPGTNGIVRAITVQSDSKILVGGDFTKLSDEARNFIARLNSDGSLDSFDPKANGNVRAIALQADGKILVGGQFNGELSIGGANRNYIARLNPSTGAADSFAPNANGAVFCIFVQVDGKILLGGSFHGASAIGGQTRNYIARLDSDGSVDSFDPNPNEAVTSIAVQTDGKVLIGGFSFGLEGANGESHSYLARLNASTGAVDSSFNPNVRGAVHSVALQSSGKIITGGSFTKLGSQLRNRVCRIDPATGTID